MKGVKKHNLVFNSYVQAMWNAQCHKYLAALSTTLCFHECNSPILGEPKQHTYKLDVGGKSSHKQNITKIICCVVGIHI